MRALALLALLAVASGCDSDFRLERVSPDTSVVGRVIGPDGDRLARTYPLDIAFVDAEHGLMSTYGGVLLRTDDGGHNWTRVVMTRGPLEYLTLLSPRLGFAAATTCRAHRCATRLVTSRDGGRHWRPIAVLERFRRDVGGSVYDLQFIDARYGWSLSEGLTLRRTLDGGRSWQALRTPCSHRISGISFLNRHRGFVLCGGVLATIEQVKELYATTNGGETWHVVVSADFDKPPQARKDLIPTQGHAAGITFRSPRDAIMTANRVGLYVTRDGGYDWHVSLNTNDGPSVNRVAWPTLRRVYALLSTGQLLRSDDSAVHWRQIYPRSLGTPSGPVSFSNDLDGIGAGHTTWPYQPEGILGTHDGGRTWTPRGSLPDRFDVSQLVRTGETTVLAVAQGLYGTASQLFRSTDDGRTWRHLAVPRATASISFPSPDFGFLIADDRKIFRSSDGGSTWTFAHRANTDVYQVAFVSAEEGFAFIGVESALVHTTNGGRTWRRLLVSGGFTAYGGAFLDPRHWWLIGRLCPSSAPARERFPDRQGSCPAHILRTSDGGQHWEAIQLRIFPGIAVFDFRTPTDGYAKDAFGIGPYRTTDGGRTWRYVYPQS